ncbi:BON domain-containing protein [Azospirillum thermophilum]|uniref:BON domain-containing protein n=1 Tax=Azospirillum thermophilum TaxID=2202148 RepID=UPI001FE4E2C7|nr:BON domain-containing protein [Azospirillum thermophilum]
MPPAAATRTRSARSIAAAARAATPALDERIREDINDRLTDDPYVDASDIDVTVSNGEVTLSGHVDHRTVRRRAEDLAESVSGVTHVQNNLRVRQDTGSGSRQDMGLGSSTGGGSTSGTGTGAGASAMASAGVGGPADASSGLTGRSSGSGGGGSGGTAGTTSGTSGGIGTGTPATTARTPGTST